ncbi:MAG TPA: hypothetical protein VJV05_05010 [Pyrinomonadaceae bacterium]|nr:hypothetical protein [Pyrinomonadaceae bacterium]
MLTKIYAVAWGMTLAAALLIFAAGSMTMLAIVVFGFIAFGLVFMGMIGVLPSTVVHTNHPAEETVVQTKESLRGRIRDYKETLTTDAFAVRKPKFP